MVDALGKRGKVIGGYQIKSINIWLVSLVRHFDDGGPFLCDTVMLAMPLAGRWGNLLDDCSGWEYDHALGMMEFDIHSIRIIYCWLLGAWYHSFFALEIGIFRFDVCSEEDCRIYGRDFWFPDIR